MSFIKPLLSSLLLGLLLLPGCAVDETSEAQHGGSSLPWNRPEKWEGAGMMGSMMQGTQ
jgi:hypothetical protein